MADAGAFRPSISNTLFSEDRDGLLVAVRECLAVALGVGGDIERPSESGPRCFLLSENELRAKLLPTERCDRVLSELTVRVNCSIVFLSSFVPSRFVVFADKRLCAGADYQLDGFATMAEGVTVSMREQS